MQSTSLENIPQQMREAIESEFIHGNKTSYVISRALNLHPNTVHAIGIQLLGHEQFQIRELKNQKALLLEVSQMQSEGLSLDAIAAKLNISKHYIFNTRRSVAKLAQKAIPINSDVVEIISISDDEPKTSTEGVTVLLQECQKPESKQAAVFLAPPDKLNSPQSESSGTCQKASNYDPSDSISDDGTQLSQKSSNMVTIKVRGAEFSYMPGSPGDTLTEDSVLRILEKMVTRGML